MNKVDKKETCKHSWREQLTIWPGVVDKRCAKCNKKRISTLPDKIYQDRLEEIRKIYRTEMLLCN
jgi:hypothetical protein